MKSGFLFLLIVIFLIASITSLIAVENVQTTSCPARIDVFDYNLIMGNTARIKAISNKQGRIEIFARGLAGTLSRDLTRLKTCDNTMICEYSLPLPIPGALSLSGSQAEYYAELTVNNPFEFVHSVTKHGVIGDQGNTNNYCKDERAIVLNGGANSPGQVCSSGGSGQCSPGYCSRSYSGTGDVGCFYPNNCVNNDALQTAVSCPTTGPEITTTIVPGTITTVSCPTKIDVFDYNLIVNKIARIKAISNKLGRISIFAEGLGPNALKVCNDATECSYLSGSENPAYPNGVNLPIYYAGTTVRYYAELVTTTGERINSLIKEARIGDQLYQNNFCADENSIVISGGANTPGARCTYAQSGQCNPGYCKRTSPNQVVCDYLSNCVNNDALRTLLPMCQGSLARAATVNSGSGSQVSSSGATQVTNQNSGLSQQPGTTQGTLSFSTNLNRPDSNTIPAKYSSGDALTWSYRLNNQGPSFNTSVCFFLKDPNNLTYDITREPVLRRANLQYYNCNIGNSINENPCPIKLENIEIGTTNQEVTGQIFTYTFPNTLVKGAYQLIAQLREPNVGCSNPDGSIINAVTIATSTNYLIHIRPPITTQIIPMQPVITTNLPCPYPNENPQFAGCFLSSNQPDNSEMENYTCQTTTPSAIPKCYRCSVGFRYDASINRCVSIGLPQDCIILQDNQPRSSKLKIVIVGDKYGNANRELFLNDVNLIKDQILSFEPFRELQNKINFYAINSEEDLGCHNNCDNIQRSFCCNDGEVTRVVSNKCPYNKIMVIVNHPLFGGAAGGIAIISRGGAAISLLVPIHELGHTFGGLVDEYSYGNGLIPYYASDVNCDNNNQCTKWGNLIGTGGVGCFEGCKYQERGLYRPIRIDSIMLDNNGDFGPVNERHLRGLLEHYT